MLKGLKESFNKYIKQKVDCITVFNVQRDNPDESKKIEHRELPSINILGPLCDSICTISSEMITRGK